VGLPGGLPGGGLGWCRYRSFGFASRLHQWIANWKWWQQAVREHGEAGRSKVQRLKTDRKSLHQWRLREHHESGLECQRVIERVFKRPTITAFATGPVTVAIEPVFVKSDDIDGSRLLTSVTGSPAE
jgi:hypothetical protein